MNPLVPSAARKGGQPVDKVSIFVETFVTPAKAGVQVLDIALDSRLRGNDIYAELGLEIKFRRFVNTLAARKGGVSRSPYEKTLWFEPICFANHSP